MVEAGGIYIPPYPFVLFDYYMIIILDIPPYVPPKINPYLKKSYSLPPLIIPSFGLALGFPPAHPGRSFL